MLLENLSIDACVCLKCGEIVAPGSFVVEKVADLPMPDDIKSKGQLLSTIACPHCREGFVFGFLAVPKDMRKERVAAPAPEKDDSVEEDVVVKDKKPKTKRKKTTKKQAEKKQQKTVVKGGVTLTEDGTIDLDAPPVRAPYVPVKQPCSLCSKMIEVPSGGANPDFKLRCSDCLKSLIRRNREA